MAGVKFYVDIENSSGTKLGSGPLASVQRWRYTARMDRAGDIAFDFAANDPQASIVANRNIARSKALINGVWVEVGAGVIDTVDTSPDAQGRVSLSASGMDLIRELSYRTVGELEIGSGSGATHSAALTAIGALAPAGWTFTPAASPDNDYIYARYGGESVLGALVYLAERTQTHFYRGTNRALTFTSAFTDSGVRAIQAYGDLESEQCAIVSLRRTVDTHDLLTRITPYGSGQGAARLTLAATSRSAPSGYTLSAANNYIEHDSAVSTYGQVDFPEIEFKEITPISNTDADLQAAANMLFDAALEELTRRATLASQETYSLTIAGCSQLLRPMQTIRVVYRDVNQNIDIDANLYILEATWEIDESGIGTTALVVSTDDRWPVSDVVAAAERAVEGRVFQAHPQLNANSYVTAYNKNVDENEVAEFRFRFGAEVVNLQQVLFEFQILPFESTVTSVASDSPTTSSGGGTTASSSSGGSHTHSVTIAAHTHSVTIADHTHTVAIAAHTHSVTIAAHTHSVTVANHTHTISVAAHTHSVTVANHTHAIPDHSHQWYVNGNDANGDAIKFAETGGGFGVITKSTPGTFAVVTDPSTGATTASSGGGQTVTSSSGGSSTPTSSSGGGQTVSSSTLAQSTPTSSSGGSSTPTSSNGGGQTVSSSTLAQTTPSSAASGGHTHDVTIAAHTHTVSPIITTVYGIFREDSGDTYVLTDLDYRVNGGSWLNCEDDAVSAGDGWYQIDITSLVQNATTFRPTAANNLLEIRSLTADKTANIDAQLSVRNTIQAIAYT